MIKFRFHRGTLDESMLTERQFDNAAQIIAYINESMCFIVTEWESKFYCYDYRIQQDCYLLTAFGWVIGFTDKELE